MTSQNAREFHQTMTLLRQGKITVDEARRRNRAQREDLGEQAYDAAKRRAMVVDAAAR